MEKEITINELAEILKQHYRLKERPVITLARIGRFVERAYNLGVNGILTIQIQIKDE